MSPKQKKILIVAGESSADRYGAFLVRRLRGLERADSLSFFGTGGDLMQAEGVQLICHLKDLASIGPREALSHLGKYLEVFRRILRECRSDPPAVALLLDFPDFNLRLAKKLKRLGITVIYYISPQLWAWRRGRVETVRKYVDKMLVILPFEEDFYRSHGVRVEFVGHPLLEGFSPCRNREVFLGGLSLDPARKTIALLPGSRRKEVGYILPTLLQASRRIMERVPGQVLISAAPGIDRADIERIVAAEFDGDEIAGYYRIVGGEARDILANSDFALVKSGTSTLEAALVGTPFLITYRLSSISWWLGSLMVRTPFKGLVNLIAHEAIVPEFLQKQATPDVLSRVALEYLEDPQKAAHMKTRLAAIREMLSARCASESVAAAVVHYL